MTNYVYDAANRLTSVNGQAYTWDNNDNLTNDGSKTYTYDQANRLTAVSGQSSAVTYMYNSEGARFKQIVNGSPTTYTLDLAAPLVQALVAKDSSGDTRYLYGVTRIGEQQSAGWVYHLSDALGSVRQLADANAQVVLARGYTPYGEPLWAQGTASSRYAFTGEDYDQSVELLFLRARYLQPTLGIFLSRDPWSGDVMRPGLMNGWNYTDGNPVNLTDPSGQVPIEPPNGGSCDDNGCQLIKTFAPLYEPFVYNANRMGQYVHARWLVKDHNKCSIAQFIDDAFRDDKNKPYGVNHNQLDGVWDLYGWNSDYLKYAPVPALGGEIIELVDLPGYGDNKRSLSWNWWELWFNARDYLYDRFPTYDVWDVAVGLLKPVPRSEITWGFKFGGYPPSWSEGRLEGGLEFYTEGPPGLPPQNQ